MQATRVRNRQKAATAGTASATGTGSSTSNAISIKGSTKIVTEFFEFSVNTYARFFRLPRYEKARSSLCLSISILYQRNIYPAEDFKMVKKYGLNMLVSTDDSLQTYLRKIMSQLNGALLVLVWSGRLY